MLGTAVFVFSVLFGIRGFLSCLVVGCVALGQLIFWCVEPLDFLGRSSRSTHVSVHDLHNGGLFCLVGVPYHVALGGGSERTTSSPKFDVAEDSINTIVSAAGSSLIWTHTTLPGSLLFNTY